MKLRISRKISSLEAGIGRGRADFGEQFGLVERPGAGDRQDMLGKHVERSGPEDLRDRARRRRSRRAPRGPRDIRSGCRGRSCPCDGSSSRWLARPIRCSRRELPLGAPIWMTRSMSPQSMPRSRLAVATSARSLPSAIAASILRRASTARLPWWMPIGSAWSFTAHRSWKISSARLRVLQNTSVVLCCSISSITSRAAWRPEWPDQGMRFSGIRIDRSGSAPGSPSTSRTSVHVGVGREPAAIGVGVGDGGAEADPAQVRARAPAAGTCDSASRSPRFSRAKAWISSTTMVLRFSNSSALSG